MPLTPERRAEIEHTAGQYNAVAGDIIRELLAALDEQPPAAPDRPDRAFLFALYRALTTCASGLGDSCPDAADELFWRRVGVDLDRAFMTWEQASYPKR